MTLNNEEEARALLEELKALLEAANDTTEDLELALQACMERRAVALPALRELRLREETRQPS